MTSTLTMEIKGLSEIASKMSNPSLIAIPLRATLNDLGLLAQRVARDEAPRDTSALARSIGLDVQPLYAKVFTPLQYAAVMEFGRAPGSKQPPPGVLLGWMSRHGIPAQFEFVLARAIARRGIRGRFFMLKAKNAVEAAMPHKLNELGKRIEQMWSSGR